MRPKKAEVIRPRLRELLQADTQDASIGIVMRTRFLFDDEMQEVGKLPTFQDQLHGTNRTFNGNLTKKEIREFAQKDYVIEIKLAEELQTS